MVVQEDDDVPVEAPVSKRTKKYVVVKNHVRELMPDHGSTLSGTGEVHGEPSNLNSNNEPRLALPSPSYTTDISKSDLEELKTVYRKCKEIMRRIETKYGNLIGLNDEDRINESSNRNEESSSNECTCLRNKKIVFDENGQQIEKEYPSGIHICPKRSKRKHNESQPQKSAIYIEYDNITSNLPDSLHELENILQDTSIDNVCRQMVINKIYLIRQENLSQIRYEKESLLKKLKENPDDLLDFKGTNMSTLPGYPTIPIQEKKKEEK